MFPTVGSVYRLGAGNRAAQFRCGVTANRAGSEELGFVTPQYAVVYVLCGRGQYVDAQGRVHRLAAGDAYQRFPSKRHDVKWESDCVRCFLAVPCQVFELLELTGLASQARPVLRVGGDRWIAKEFSALRAELGACPDERLIDVLARMQQFLVRLLRGDRARPGAALDAPIAQAMQVLSEDLAGRIALPAVARRVGMGYSAFRKQFAEQAGLSPRDFRIRRRIERAVALLTRENLRIKEIAARLGYPDEYAFSAQFKKRTGLSPRAFRERHA
ncbi:MAG: helix-turn-helix transcriptional regulator [Planctomycetota bacterium]|nr:helix-turn-helix transcriptional regulator [Planctomycetota bacterium]